MSSPQRFLPALLTLGLLAGHAGATVPGLQIPAGIEVTEVASSMTWNGIPMKVMTFRSSFNIDRTLSLFQDTLMAAGAEHPSIEGVLDLQTLGALVDGVFINVQGQDRTGAVGSAGYIVFSPMLDALPDTYPGVDLPLPADFSFMSHETFDEGDRQGESVLGYSPGFASEVGAQLVERFTEEGWEPAPSEPAAFRTQTGAELVRWLRKDERLCRLLVMDQLHESESVAVSSVVCHN